MDIVRNPNLLPMLKLDDQKFEFIFLLDRSGSMSGTPLELTKQAVVFFLHSLPADCYFNIISFGLSFQLMFPQSVKYSQQSLTQAKQILEGYDASLNSTGASENLYNPLQQIYKSNQFPGYLTQLFVLTDGDIENQPTVVQLVKSRVTHSRLFCLGLGQHGSTRQQRLTEIATAGGGTADFIPTPHEVQLAVLNQLKTALKPALLKPIRIMTTVTPSAGGSLPSGDRA